MRALLPMLMAYKAWANTLTYAAVAEIGTDEATRPRATAWESIAYTLSHVWVVDDIFRHHLQGRAHPYTFRNTLARLPLAELDSRQRAIDGWYSAYAGGLTEAAAGEEVEFAYVGSADAGGGPQGPQYGRMTRAAILLHLVNHATYHRGLVRQMMYEGAMPHGPAPQPAPQQPANDLTVFLRDHWPHPQET